MCWACRGDGQQERFCRWSQEVGSSTKGPQLSLQEEGPITSPVIGDTAGDTSVKGQTG